MRIYRAHRFSPPPRNVRGPMDPRLDTFALMLILLDLILLGLFAWWAATGQAVGEPPNRLILRMTVFSAIPSLLGLILAGYMRRWPYLFTLPLLAVSFLGLPVLNYWAASYLARPFLPYTVIEAATRRTYVIASRPVTVHVYPGSREAVPVLIAVLQDPQSPSRASAVQDVGTVGPAAAAAVPLLDQIMRDRDRDLSYQASQALVKMGEPGIQALIEALKAEQDRIRLVAILGLQNAGPAGKPAIPELDKMWSKSDPAMRSQIELAIANLRRQRDRS